MSSISVANHKRKTTLSRVVFLLACGMGEEKPGASCRRAFRFRFVGAACRPCEARDGFRIPVPQPKNPTRKSWIFSFVPIGTTSFAWHTQHHLTVRSTSLPLAAQMNEVEALPQMMLQQVAKDVMLRINDVALRANGAVAVRSVR